MALAEIDRPWPRVVGLAAFAAFGFLLGAFGGAYLLPSLGWGGPGGAGALVTLLVLAGSPVFLAACAVAVTSLVVRLARPEGTSRLRAIVESTLVAGGGIVTGALAAAAWMGGPAPPPGPGDIRVSLAEIGNRAPGGGYEIPYFVVAGDRVPLTATAGHRDSRSDPGRFSWTSSDTSVLVVDVAGVAHTRAAGHARIVATFDSIPGRPLDLTVVPGNAATLELEAPPKASRDDTLRVRVVTRDPSGSEVAGIPVAVVAGGRAMPCAGAAEDRTPCWIRVHAPRTDTLDLRARTWTTLHRATLHARTAVPPIQKSGGAPR